MTGRVSALALAAVAVAGGAALIVVGVQPKTVASPSLGAPPAATAPAPALHSVAPAARRAAPAQVVIPAISVNATVIPEGIDPAGALEMPPLTAQNLAGWWDGGAAPGQDGPAVIAGHVDSAQAGPLVFWNLRLLKPGDVIETEPGSLRFTVTRVTQVGKDSFPTEAVYGPTPDPELRLVTCGGPFDSSTGHYTDNVIVYATETQQ
jgi:sortase (surface protein transpeptidase)